MSQLTRAQRRNQERAQRNAKAREGALDLREPDEEVPRREARSRIVIDDLFARRVITDNQHGAAERLLKDASIAGWRQRVIANWGAMIDRLPIGSFNGEHEISDARAAADSRVKAALRSPELGRSLWPIISHVVLDNGDPATWAMAAGLSPRTGVQVLRLALAGLARHYADADRLARVERQRANSFGTYA